MGEIQAERCVLSLDLLSQLYEPFVWDGDPTLCLKGSELEADQGNLGGNFLIGRFVDVKKVIWTEQGVVGDEVYLGAFLIDFL